MRSTSPREKYINEVFGVNDPDLQRVRERLTKHELDFMAISGHEGRLLQFLVRGFGVKTVVEVGTLFGFSALCMAKALPPDGKVYALEKSEENYAIAKEMIEASSVRAKIDLLNGDALELLAKIPGPVDMVFIDANKGGYVDYLNWAEKNVRPGGLIVGDNTFLFGALWGESRDRDMGPNQIKVMAEFNQRLSDPKKYNSTIIPSGEGMTVAQKL